MTDMPPPARPTLRAFLAGARRALAAPPAQRQAPLTLVVGNESADLDSLCSTLLQAYLLGSSQRRLHIPLSNLPRADLALRPELAAVLRRAGIRPADLLTLTDLPPPDGLPAAATRWLLVDHNVMTGELGRRFGGRVVGCVDHHEDEAGEFLGAEEEEGEGAAGDEPRVIRPCGSCASLVVEHSRAAWEELASRGQGGDGDGDIDAQLAHVALGPILIDTTNLTSKDKTTDTDVRAVKFAEGLIRRAGVGYDRDEYFREITELKEDLSQLSYRDIFRKDYKQWADGRLTLGTSSVAQGFGYLLERIGDREVFLSELKKWSEEQKLDIVAVLTTLHPDGKFARELLVWALNADAVKVMKAFADKSKDDLGLGPWQDGKLDHVEGQDEWRMCWSQSRIEHSRKKVAPMLRDAMRQASK